MVCVPTLRLLVVKVVWPPPFTAVGPARVVPGLEQVPPSMKLTLPSVTAVLSHFVTVAVSVTEVWNLELAGAAPSVVAVPAGQLLLVPSQVGATSQTPEGPHTVPAGLLASAGQVVLVPSQVSLGSHISPDPARQTKVLGRTPSGGQVALLPVHDSATSHTSAAARHTVPALPGACWQRLLLPLQVSVVHGLPSSVHAVPFALNVQSAAQHEPAVPFAAPSSHCSGLSATPLPHVA